MYISTDIRGQFTNLLHSKHYKSLYLYMDRNDKYPSCIFITLYNLQKIYLIS